MHCGNGKWWTCSFGQLVCMTLSMVGVLQERVGTVEKQKSELMMQATLMQQAGPSHVVQMPSHYAAGNILYLASPCFQYLPLPLPYQKPTLA